MADGKYEETASYMRTLFWFGLFTISSAGMVLLNKLIMTRFPFPAVLIFAQNGGTIVFQLVGTQLGIFDMKPWRLEHFKKWSIAAVLFVCVLGTSLMALPHIAVATTIVFRNLGTFIVSFGDAAIFGKQFSTQMKLGLVIMFIGSLVYTSFDPNFNAVGYFWIAANTLLWAVSNLFEKWATVTTDQTSVGISCYENVVTLPILLISMVASEEAAASQAKFAELSGFIKMCILLTVVFGCSLSICYMSLNKFASATAITIAGNCNKLISAIVGAYVFHATVRANAVIGLLVCVGGALTFSFAPKPGAKTVDDSESMVELVTGAAELARGEMDEAKASSKLLNISGSERQV
eukprot:g1981.t1